MLSSLSGLVNARAAALPEPAQAQDLLMGGWQIKPMLKGLGAVKANLPPISICGYLYGNIGMSSQKSWQG
jgi:hypothetical protein